MTKTKTPKVKTIEEQYALIFKRLVKLIEKEKMTDVSIYYEGKRFSYNRETDEIKVEENMDVTKYLKYCNPNGVSIIYDGSVLNQAINYDGSKTLLRKFENITKGTDIYHQFGYAWSASYYD